MTNTTPTYGLFLLQQNDTNNVDNLNLNIERLDAFSNLVVQDEVETPPANPNYGRVWLVGATPGGEFSGHAGELAAWVSNNDDPDGWVFQAPFEGLSAYFVDEGTVKTYNGTTWASPGATRTVSAGWPMTRVETGQGSSVARQIIFYTDTAITIGSARYVFVGNVGSTVPTVSVRYDSAIGGTVTNGTSLIAPGDWSTGGETTTGNTISSSVTVPANNYVYFYLESGTLPSNVDAEQFLISVEYAE